jgi:HAD superfamily phosphatase
VDGVLIDTRLSYNLAIKKTVKYVLDLLNSPKTNQPISDNIILKMRRTGGFNNDTDTTYALILASLVSQLTNAKELDRLLFDVTNNIDARGIISVERYLSTVYSGATVEKIKHKLSYPGPIGRSIVTTVFDEVFYGTKLFKQRYDIYPQYYIGDGLIDNERIIDLIIVVESFREEVNWHLSTLFRADYQFLTKKHAFFWKMSQEKMQNLILMELEKP